jgi:glycosyltransferase involved in cell wall biosynthesis
MPSPKERLILSANATPGRGGQGMNLFHMVAGLRDLFDVSVFCRGGDVGVPHVDIPSSRRSALMGRVPLLRRLRDWQGLFDEINFDTQVSRRLGPSAFFQGTTGQCLESLAKAKANGSFTILDSVTFHIDQYHAELARECSRFGVRSPLNATLCGRVREEYERADAIRVMSEPARRSFLERGFSGERVFVAPPPFDISQFPQADFQGSKFTISFVGLLEPAKGFQYLIEGFRLLNRTDSELLLWGNTGARPLARYLAEQMSECPMIRLRAETVKEIGYDKVYGASSVLVHPSLSDGFGYVVGEAMASGIPVITTPMTGASEWIVDGVNGYVVPPRDPQAICERLEFLISRPALVREMGAAARETIAKLTLEHFQSCILDGIGKASMSRLQSR